MANYKKNGERLKISKGDIYVRKEFRQSYMLKVDEIKAHRYIEHVRYTVTTLDAFDVQTETTKFIPSRKFVDMFERHLNQQNGWKFYGNTNNED